MKIYSLPIEKLDFIKEPNKDFIKLKMYTISTKENRNESEFLEESFPDGIQTYFNKPILAYFNNKIQDTEGHNTQLKIEKESGEFYYDFNFAEAEKPVGVIPESANIYVEQQEDKKWIVVDGGLIWTAYNRALTRLIKRQLKKKISVEIEVVDSYMEGKIEKIKAFNFLGVTILGKTPDGRRDIEEGIEGAHLRLMNFSSNENFVKYSKALTVAYNNKNMYKDIIDKIFKDLFEYPQAITDKLLEELTPLNLLAEEDVSPEIGLKVLSGIVDVKDHVVEIYSENLNKLEMELANRFKAYISADEVGTGDSIKLALSKKSASNDAWSEVDKTNLRNDILRASNYQTLVQKCYLVVEDGWKDHPSESLKYPVCQIKNGKLVYNINGVQAALSRLEQNTNASYYKSATAKLNKIYEKLSLDEDRKHAKFSGLEVFSQMKEIFESLFAEKKELKYIGNTENKVLALSFANNTFVMIPFEKDEEGHVVMKEEMAKETEIYAKFEDEESEDKEEFGCGKGMAEEFANVNKEADEKKAEFENVKATMEAEKEAVEKEKEEMSAKFESEKTEMMATIEKMEAEVSQFKTEKFEKIVESYSKKFSLSAEESDEWKEKSKTFNSFVDFEKDLVFAFHSRTIKEEPNHVTTGFERKTNAVEKKSALQRLKEKASV